MEPGAGTMLYLASRRPKEDAVIAKVENPVEVNNQEAFSWVVTTETSGEEVVSTLPVVTDEVAEAKKAVQEVTPKDVDSLKILQASKTPQTLEDAPEETALAIPANRQHTVQAGETLYGIARLYNVSDVFTS